MTTIYTDNLKAALAPVVEAARKCPANDTLTADNLNAVLDLMDQAKVTFLTMCEVNGFNLDHPFNRFDHN